MLLNHPRGDSQYFFLHKQVKHLYLGQGICNQHFSSQCIPFLSSLLPWGMRHTWLQYCFYKSSSEMVLFTSFAYFFVLLWNLLVHQEINVKCLAGRILMHLKFFTTVLNLFYLHYQESCHICDKTLLLH